MFDLISKFNNLNCFSMVLYPVVMNNNYFYYNVESIENKMLFVLLCYSNMCNAPKKLLSETELKKKVRYETCRCRGFLITNQYAFALLDW